MLFKLVQLLQSVFDFIIDLLLDHHWKTFFYSYFVDSKLSTGLHTFFSSLKETWFDGQFLWCCKFAEYGSPMFEPLLRCSTFLVHVCGRDVSAFHFIFGYKLAEWVTALKRLAERIRVGRRNCLPWNNWFDLCIAFSRNYTLQWVRQFVIRCPQASICNFFLAIVSALGNPKNNVLFMRFNSLVIQRKHTICRKPWLLNGWQENKLVPFLFKPGLSRDMQVEETWQETDKLADDIKLLIKTM